MKKKNNDMLKLKEEKLSKLNQQSSSAVDLVTQTINNLQNINDEIDTTISEMEDYKAKLEATKTELKSTHSKNNKIISNFKALLN